MSSSGFVKLSRGLFLAAAFATTAFATPAAAAEETIKVGVLHSLSGTMAISETTLKDVMLMLIEEQNKKGGLLGKKLEAVVVDPASDWPLFAEKARELIAVDKVAAVFGCWTSVSRKSVLPVFEELNGLLFYPVQYEGEESSKNVFYTGAAPNQQAIPAVDYLMANEEVVKRWVLAGTDYVYPRTTNKILEAYLKAKGVAAEDIMINYTPFGHSDWQTIVSDIKKFGSAGKKTAVVSTINGDANVPFYKELGNQGITAEDIPVVAFSVGEEELAGLDTGPLVGHLAAWNYFQSRRHAEQRRVHQDLEEPSPRTTSASPTIRWKRMSSASTCGSRRSKKAGTTDPDAVIDAIIGVSVPNLSGGIVDDDAEPSHHQAGADRRNPGERPVRHRVADVGPRRRRRMVGLSAGLEGPDLRLAQALVLRQLQCRHRQVRGPGQLMPGRFPFASGGGPSPFRILPPPTPTRRARCELMSGLDAHSRIV